MVCFIIDIRAHCAHGARIDISVSLFIHLFLVDLAWHCGYRHGYLSSGEWGMTSCIFAKDHGCWSYKGTIT